jgi:HAE1 family hydrophobic/amphiphilic exporter-1
MHPIEAFVRNPIKVAVGVLLVSLFGIIGLIRMPMQLTPEVNVPTITIETRWRGASPQEVEREIVQEQEEQLQGVQGMTKLSSESLDSQGRITLEFQVGTDMQEALVRVNSRLAQVPEYPLDADEPVIATSDASDRPIAWFILSAQLPTAKSIAKFQENHPELAELVEPARRVADANQGLATLRLQRLAAAREDLRELLKTELLPAEKNIETLRKFAEDYIEARLERVKGVSNSNVFGGRDPELQVVVDAHQLAARGLTIMDVRAALAGHNKDTSGGDFYEGKRRWVIRTLGQYRSIEQVENQIIATHDGQAVYVRDITVPKDGVHLGYKKPDGLVRRFGNASIAVNAERSTGANVMDVMEGLREANAELNDGLLARQGLQLTQVYDETEYIESAISLVNQNIIFASVLTVVVLILFLRSVRSTLVIALTIPTSIIGTFLVLNLLGRSLNVISLAGLAFAVGMLVDNAVVVLENIYRHYQQGDDPFRAAVTGTKEVWGAVVASTLTTLAVFLPVLFVQEEAGQLFRDIAIAISAAVALSLVLSVTVIPTLSARLLRTQRRETEGAQHGLLAPIYKLAALFVRAVVGFNAWTQQAVWRELLVVVLLIGSSVGISIALWPKVEYLPPGNRNLVISIILPPPGYNLDELMDMGQLVENELKPYWDVDPDDAAGIEKMKYPVIGDWFYVARGRSVFMGLRAAEPTRAWELVPLIRQVGAKLPGTFVIANQSSLFEQGLAAGRSIDIEITGPKLEKLVGLGGQIMAKVLDPKSSDLPDAQARPIPSLDLSSPEVHVTPRSEQSAEMQLNTVDLGYTVDALVDGAYATDYYLGGDKIDLVIIGSDEFAQKTQDIEELPVVTPDGRVVPLGALAEVNLSSGPEQINRRERQRAITISVTPPPDMPLQDALQRIQDNIVTPLQNSGQLEADGERYVITLSGTADKLRDTWRALRWNVVLALLITYLLMAALFESWFYPFVIICSVPLAAVGGIVGLQMLNLYQSGLAWLTHSAVPPTQKLDVLTMLGFVILIGTAVNNAILIVYQSINHMRDDAMRPQQAILESVRTRIRPIFMTTTTTVFGLAPLVLFPGAGSELYRGLGSVVLGGLVVSTLFTLVLVPTLFNLTMSTVNAVKHVFGRGDMHLAEEGEPVPESLPVAS